MNMENRPLFTDEPVEVEKPPVEVPDLFYFRRINHRFRGIYEVLYLKLIEKNQIIVTIGWGLEIRGF